MHSLSSFPPLGMCVQLQRLELRRCRIDGLGASVLSRGIEAPGCPISMLCVDGNSFDGDEGAMPFGGCMQFLNHHFSW